MSSLTVARAPEARSSRGSVLVVDDEPTVAEVVSRHLQRAGYATEIAADGATALDAATALHPDLIVLDVKRPRIDGLEMMRQLRSEDHMTPAVIMLSGRGGESDRVIGLRSGADDYVVKPFSPLELVARVEAILRRAQPGLASEAVLEVGEIRIDRAARRVVVRGSEVRLAQKEYDLLLYLAQHQGQAFSRDDLIRAVWRYSFYTDTSTVTVHIRRLRAKIETDPAKPRHLRTVWGVGYRFEP
ncbi:MAG: response regulator transcription factor [Solirubrobacterales bacterium]|nr:response regulator transcription factor [Solirubrobacterales bacterium]